jgi:spore germination protein GerM
VVIFGLFLINKDRIRKTLKDTQFIERLFNQPLADTSAEPLTLPETPAEAEGRSSPRAAENPAAETTKPPPVVPKQEPAKPPAAQTSRRDRTLYFTQIDSDGAILRVKTVRSLAVSDSPMVDALGALILGPDAEEKRRGMVSLIPQGARILNATVRGNTAYISFSEDLQYNTYGVEGYAAALKQIVWTVTEFSNVRDVQILIEGRRVDYLGEGIWIGSPVSREMFNQVF